MVAFLKLGKKKKEETPSKKEQPKEPSKEQIPSELPTLSQDVLNEAIPDEAASTSNKEEIPDELPSLDIETAAAPEKPEPKKEVLEEPKAEPVGIKEEPKLEEEPKEPPKPLEVQSYFYQIIDKLKQKKPSEDILQDMKSYWKKQKLGEEELKTSTQKELESSMKQKIRELQELEAGWVENRRSLEHTKHMIASIEADISIKSEELKKILEKLEKVESIYNKIKNQPEEGK